MQLRFERARRALVFGARRRRGAAQVQHLAQPVALDLAGLAARDGIDEDDAPRHLEAHQGLQQVRGQRLFVERRARPAHHGGGDLLAQRLVGDREHRHFGDLGRDGTGWRRRPRRA